MPALLTVGFLTLPLAACGADASEEKPTVEAAEETEAAEEGGNVLDLLGKLGENTQDISNYTLDIDISMPDPDLGEIDMTMAYEVMDDPQASQVTMVMPAMGEMLLELATMGGSNPGLTAEELGTSILIIPAEGETLISNHNDLQEADTPWVRGSQGADELAPEEMFDLQSLPKVVDAVAGIEQIEKTGTEEVSGVGTTLVEGTMTSEDVEALDPEQKLAVQELVGAVDGTVDVSIWIDDSGFPMRLDFSNEEADVSMVFSDLGETAFEIPSEEEITDI